MPAVLAKDVTCEESVLPVAVVNDSPSAGEIGRTFLRVAGRIATGLIALLVLAVLLLQLDSVTTRLLPVAGRFLPWDNATIEADRASLSGLSRITARKLRVTADDGRTILTVDSVDLAIRPLALVAGRLDIPAVRAVGVRAVARQQADSSWDLVAPFTARSDTMPAGEPMSIRIGLAEIRDVSFTGFYANPADSLRIDDLLVQLEEFRTGEGIAFTLDTVSARVTAPGRTRPAVLSARARLSEGQLTVTGFRLESDSSRVTARGNLVLPGPTGREIRDVDFRLAAEPLDFRDIQPLVPELKLPASMRLTARISGRSSLLQLDVDGRTSDGAEVTLEGELTPAITGPVQYRLEGSARNLDPRMLGLTDGRGRTSAEFNLALKGDSLPVVSGDASIRLGSIRLGDGELAPSRLTARFDQGTARYRLDGALLPWVRVTGEGTLSLFRETPSYTATLRLSQAKALPDSGPLQVYNIIALVRARGRGFSAAQREGTATFGLEGQIGDAAIADARGEANWQPAEAVVRLSARLAGNRALLDSIGANLEWRRGNADIRLSFADLNLSRAAPGLPASRLDGSARFAFRPGPPERMSGRGTLDLHGDSLGISPVGPGRFSLELARGLVTLGGNLQALEGSLYLIGSARPFDAVAAFTLDRLRFEAVEFASVTGSRLRDPLSGTLTARGTLPPDSLPQLTGRLALDPGPFNRGRLDTLDAAFSVQGRKVRLEATARTGEGEITLTGESEILPNGNGNGDNGSASWTMGATTVDGRFNLPDLAALIADSGSGGLAGRIHLQGQGTHPETMQWDARANASGRWEQARLDSLRLEGRIADGRLTLDTLLVDSNLLRGGGGGSTPITRTDAGPGDTVAVRLVADTTAPATLSGLFGVDPLSARVGSIEMLAWQKAEKLQLRGSVSFGGLIAGAGGADSLDLVAGAALGRSGLTDLNGTLTGLRVAWSRVELERLEARLESDGNRFTFEGKAVRDNEHEFEIAAHGVAGERTLYFSGFGFGFGSIRWALADTATVSWGDRIVVRGFDLRDGDRRIAIEGHLDRRATQALTVQLDSVPLQQFAEFADIEGLNAVLHGTIRVDGPAAQPGVHTALTLSVPSVTARLATRPAGDLLRVDVELAAEEGRNLTVQGTVPNRLSLLRNPPPPTRESEPVSLVIRSGGFPLDWMTPFLQGYGVDRLGGLLQADARIEGTVASPRVSGTAGLAEGRVRLRQQGIDYRGITGRLSLTGNRLQLESWRAEADGSAAIEGNLVLAPLDDPRLDLRVRFDGFRAIRNDFVRLGLNGDAGVTGTLSAPRLSGRLTLEKTDVFADRVGQNPSLRPVTLTARDFDMLESYFGYRPGTVREQRDLLMPWTIDLNVRVGGDTWLRKQGRPEVRVLLTGSLDVRKEAGDSLQLFGTVEAVPARSVIEQFGKRFAIEEGTITFNGPLASWRADIAARYEVPAYKDPGAAEVAITLNVQGGANDMRLTLGSEPAMETTDIVSYLATGRPSRSAGEFGGDDGASSQSSAFAIGALADVLEDEAGQQIGLDVMEIRQDPAEGTLVIAGRYVSPKLYLGFQQPITHGDRKEGLEDQAQGTQVELEYTLYRWLLLNLQGGSEFRWFFRTRYAF